MEPCHLESRWVMDACFWGSGGTGDIIVTCEDKFQITKRLLNSQSLDGEISRWRLQHSSFFCKVSRKDLTFQTTFLCLLLHVQRGLKWCSHATNPDRICCSRGVSCRLKEPSPSQFPTFAHGRVTVLTPCLEHDVLGWFVVSALIEGCCKL